MVRGKRVPAGHRSSDAGDRHGSRGSDIPWRDIKEPEDDPLRDLRPVDEEPEPGDPDGDEFVWPEMSDQNEDDD